MGKTNDEMSTSCTFHPTRAWLHVQILFEDGPHKGLHNWNVYIHQPVLRLLPLNVNYFSVLNPSIRMSWILKNWEKEWSDNAVNIIQELVSILFLITYFITDNYFLDGGILRAWQTHCHVSQRRWRCCIEHLAADASRFRCWLGRWPRNF